MDLVVVPAGSESTGRASMKSSGVLVVPEGVKRDVQDAAGTVVSRALYARDTAG